MGFNFHDVIWWVMCVMCYGGLLCDLMVCMYGVL